MYGAVCWLTESNSCLTPSDLVNTVPDISLDFDLTIIGVSG